MSAAPIIPGQLYHVRGFGYDMEVIASGPCHALQMLVDLVIAAGKCK